MFKEKKLESAIALECSTDGKKFGNLSSREMEFISLACCELTYEEVAGKMNLSPKTIDEYRESLFHKLDLKSRVGLVLFAVKNKLVVV